MKRRFNSLATLGLVLLVSVVTAMKRSASRNEYLDQTYAQLTVFMDSMQMLGFTKDVYLHLSPVARTQHETIGVSDVSFAGKYVYIAVCDKDCSGLNLSVKAEDGTILGSDTGGTDAPVVMVTFEHAQSLVVSIDVTNCTGTCIVGWGKMRQKD